MEAGAQPVKGIAVEKELPCDKWTICKSSIMLV